MYLLGKDSLGSKTGCAEKAGSCSHLPPENPTELVGHCEAA